MDLQISGFRALVTGSSRGIGYAVAHVLSEEGAQVVINGRDPERLSRAASRMHSETGARVEALAGDLTAAHSPGQLVARTVELLGGLDLLVTNSGGPPAGKFEAHSDEAWQKSFELNFMSHVRLIRAALPFLRQSKAASVLTVTSYSTKQPIHDLILSNSIRLATIGLTKSLALELGRDGIRFNSILPAWTNTERIQELMQARARANSTTVAEEVEKQARDSALGRPSSPQELAKVAVFLLSPCASYVTGVMLPVDGGLYKGTF